MKLKVSPINGWGWFDGKGAALDVPPPFEVEVTVTQAGDPFTSVLGQMAAGRPSLAGQVADPDAAPHSFAQGFDGYCNVFGFDAKPVVPKINEALTDTPSLRGSVLVDEIID